LPRRKGPQIKLKDFGAPGYLWTFAVLPWGLLIVAMGGCIWGLLAGLAAAGSSAIGVALVQARRLPVGLRLAGLLALNGVAGLFGILLIALALNLTPGGAAPPAQARPTSELFVHGPRQYLSDLQEVQVVPGPWPLSRNGVIGPENNPIAVNGVRSPKGLGLHPPDHPGFAAVRYHLDRKAAVFKSGVALNDTAQRVFSQAVFEVYGDHKRLWQSAPVGKGTGLQECSIDVSGVIELELHVASQGSHFGLHAVWVEPRLLQKVDTPDK
jgi:hypothetical protein